MNSNEAICYLLQYLPWQLTGLALIQSEFLLSFAGSRAVLLPNLSSYKTAELDNLIRNVRRKYP